MKIVEQAYVETKASYDKLDQYLSRILIDPEQEALLKQMEALGEVLYQFHLRIIEKNSALLNKEQCEFQRLIDCAQEANAALDKKVEQVEKVAKIAKAVDKILEQVTKLF